MKHEKLIKEENDLREKFQNEVTKKKNQKIIYLNQIMKLNLMKD